MLDKEDVDLVFDAGDENEVCRWQKSLMKRLADWSKYSIKKTLT